MRHQPLHISALAVIAATCLVGTGIQSAQADDGDTPIDDPLALIQQIDPTIADQTTPLDGVGDSAAPSSSSASAVTVPADASAAVELLPPDGVGSGQPLDITVLGAEGQTTVSDGIAVLPSTDDAVVAYVQPTGSGVRLLTAISNAGAGNDFSYSLDVSSAVHLETVGPDWSILVDSNGDYIADLAPAWAKDASGRSLPTSYSLDGNVLTQHIDYDADTQFPVLADPAWQYSYNFYAGLLNGTGSYNVTYPKASAVSAWNLLHRCFNCYFPIAGAPSAYPSDGQRINLNASPFSFIAVPAPVVKWSYDIYGMELVAQPGHFTAADRISSSTGIMMAQVIFILLFAHT